MPDIHITTYGPTIEVPLPGQSANAARAEAAANQAASYASGVRFPTRAALIAATLSASANSATLDGYTVLGDASPARYIRVATAPAHEMFVTSADGAIWEFSEPRIDVRQAGAVGDGVANDAPAIQRAINYAALRQRALVFGMADYRIDAMLTIGGKIRIEGLGAVLKPTFTADVITMTAGSAGTFIHSLHIDGGGRSICAFDMRFRVTLESCSAYNISVVAGQSPRRGAFCLHGSDSLMRDCAASAIYQTGGMSSNGRALSIETTADRCQVERFVGTDTALGVVVAGKYAQFEGCSWDCNADNCYYLLGTSLATRVHGGNIRTVNEPIVVLGSAQVFENVTWIDPISFRMIQVQDCDGLLVRGCRQIFTSDANRDSSIAGILLARIGNTLSKNIRIENCFIEVGAALWGSDPPFFTRNGAVEDWVIKGCHLRFYVPTAGSATLNWFAWNEQTSATQWYELSDTTIEIQSLDPGASTYTLEMALPNFTQACTVSNVRVLARRLGSVTPAVRLRNTDRANFNGQGTVNATFGFVTPSNRNQRISWSTAPPSVGTYIVGDTHYNTAPATGQPSGWVCTVAGTPGTWRPLANVT